MPPVHSTERIGTQIAGKYQVLRFVAEGGMGTVFEATHVQARRRVALKLLRPEFVDDSDAVERFLREARAASAVSHPSIVEILEYGRSDDGTPYIAMAYLEGESLAEKLYRSGRIDEATAVLTLLPVVSALAKVHARGIIHRDLKPENVLLTRGSDGSERAVLLDFGVARFESDPDGLRPGRGGTVLGTPAYMSPEQAAGQSQVDVRTDIYAMGAMFYELVSGATPYQKGSHDQTFAAIQAGPPRPLAGIIPTVSPAMEATVNCAMARSPADRFESMDELGRALEEVLAAPTQGGLALRGRPAALASLHERAERDNHGVEHLPGADLVEEGVHTVMMDTPIAPVIPGVAPPPPSVPSPPPAPEPLSPSPQGYLGLPPLPPGLSPSAPWGSATPRTPRSRAPRGERVGIVAGVVMAFAGIGIMVLAEAHARRSRHHATTVIPVDALATSPPVALTPDAGDHPADAAAVTPDAAGSDVEVATDAGSVSGAVVSPGRHGHHPHGHGTQHPHRRH